jgi:hypothetical protein
MTPKAVVDVFDTPVAETLTPLNRSHTLVRRSTPWVPIRKPKSLPGLPKPFSICEVCRRAEYLDWMAWLVTRWARGVGRPTVVVWLSNSEHNESGSNLDFF